eukprot:SAG25_NODE_151_length_13647_cov_64.042220_2_plen_128_part_00
MARTAITSTSTIASDTSTSSQVYDSACEEYSEQHLHPGKHKHRSSNGCMASGGVWIGWIGVICKLVYLVLVSNSQLGLDSKETDGSHCDEMPRLRVRTVQPVAEWECEYSFHVCIMMPALAASYLRL